MTATRISDWIRGNVLGLAAIFLALSSTAYATHPGGADTISSGDIINEEVKSVDLKNGEVKTDDLGVNSVGSAKIADRQVKNADLSIGASSSNTIADGGIQGVDVKSDTLTGTQIDEPTLFNDDSLTDEDLAPSAQFNGTAIRGGDLAGTYPHPTISNDAVDGSTVDDGSLTGDDIDQATLTSLWRLGGNAGTTAADFLGTTDNQPLNLRVNAARALRLEPASDGTNQSPNVIGGISDNSVAAGVHSATIAGGGRAFPADPASAHRVTDDFGTVGGGASNQAGDGAGSTSDHRYATVSGGFSNTASAAAATVGGGESHTASAFGATVSGGFSNAASGEQASVGGGGNNEASGAQAAIPGGSFNSAQGVRSFAAGTHAKANHAGAFVWADNQFADMASTAADQFIARAQGEFFLQSDSTLDDQGGFLNTSTGGFLSTGGAWTNASDENLKSGFERVEPRGVLERVAELPVRSWYYDAEPGVRHLGPTAQDFHRAFGVGSDNRHIASVDADGVALAAIKGLSKEVDRLRRKLASLKQRKEFQ